MRAAFGRLFVGCAKGTRNYTVRSAELQVPTSTSVLDYVWSGLESGPGNGAAIHCPQSGRRIAYERLRNASGSFAAWLSNNCPGSLALLLPNCPEAVVSSLAALEAGVPLAPLNPDSTIEELTRALNLTRSSWIVTRSSLVHAALDAKRSIEEKTKEEYPLRIISIDDDIVFNEVIHFVDLTEFRGAPSSRRNEDIALLSQAWSESGLKPLPVSGDSLIAGCLQSSLPHLAPGDRVASNQPIFTRYGLTNSVLGVLAAGAELVILPPKEDLNNSLNKYKPSVASVVPSSLETLQSPPEGLRCLTVAGLLNQEAAKRLAPSFSGRMIQHYGPPEGPVAFSQTIQSDCTRLGQPVPGTEARVTAGGGEVGVMSEGEIWVRGPQFGHGDSWVSTGDKGYYDPEGTFYLTKAACLAVDGLAVWPGELESVLKDHEGIAAAAVFGNGQSLIAAVMPSDPYNPPSPQDLKLWFTSKTSPHKKLTSIIVTSSLPLTDEGELDRKVLAERYILPPEYATVSAV